MALSNSIFDIPNRLEDLPPQENIIKISTRKIVPKSASKGADFSSSTISFDWVVSGNQYWIPSRSFVVIRDRVYVGSAAGAAVQPTMSDDVAPAYGCQDNLFDGAELTIGGYSISNKTKLCPQISACEKRLLKSAGWLGGAGDSVMTQKPFFHDRKADCARDGCLNSEGAREQNLVTLIGTCTWTAATGALVGAGSSLFLRDLAVGMLIQVGAIQQVRVLSIADDTNAVTDAHPITNVAGGSPFYRVDEGPPTARASRNERLYQPPLGVWRSGKALPGARYELHLRPKADVVYKQSALQSKNAALTVGGGLVMPGGLLAAGSAEYNIEDIYLILAVVDRGSAAPSKENYVLDLEETDCLPRQITATSGQENYTVSKSTFGLSVALQDSRAGRDTRHPPSLFMAGDNFKDQESLTQLRVDYAGQSRPSPDAQLAFTDSLLQVGAPLSVPGVNHLSWYGYGSKAVEDLSFYDTGGAATMRHWRALGPLYNYQWRKQGSDTSTDVGVAFNYTPAFNPVNANLLLFYHHRRVVTFTVQNGQVTSFTSGET